MMTYFILGYAYTWWRGDELPSLPSLKRFWIGHRADNDASKRGILKAGFQLSNIGVMTPDYQPRAVPRGDRERTLFDPQGKYFGFIELADKDMTMFNFENMGDGPLVNSG